MTDRQSGFCSGWGLAMTFAAIILMLFSPKEEMCRKLITATNMLHEFEFDDPDYGDDYLELQRIDAFALKTCGKNSETETKRTSEEYAREYFKGRGK